ncbi:NADH:ubiquinone reductase (Na(+)-transporting) subunit F [Spirochaeta thermophila]|uniref:Na(+)-translocating NADH-quinone reductase subunit F n=1 Tax=Winmispira thermophila (strain ATCC 49972 / DSM 6192 / RI 19.B1) TaxID=665571 RepID=E0RP95_WINT6|nr:2Fe-2S iron-sulfur cluster binding domain-containing protein [Spirochaeta thermophila]ADN01289.1 Na(+)-translocating NADH-quinone reductase subunit F [Spirochaeta thermophila DSM 6192]
MSALVIAPLAVGGITAALALLIWLTDRVVNNYGTVTISINGGKKTLTVKGGSPLLLTLAQEQIFIPSACGGRGSCGACKVRVETDIGPHLPTEVPYLTEEERARNVRLSCQVKVKHDLSIEVPEELFLVRRVVAEVSSIRDLTHDIKEVRFRLPEGERIPFKPGQYVQLEVPPYAKIKEPTQRAYSISSLPDEEEIELLIRKVPGGIATTYVHEHMKEGERLALIGPFGDFYLRETDAVMLCVAGGSGMAPFKSILLDMYRRGVNNRQVWFFFGARTRRDLFYVDLWRDLEEKWPVFRFVPALSEDPDYEGEKGLITEVLARYIETTMDREAPKEGYLCGSPGMLDACMNVMRRYGIPEDKIYFDKFA